MDFHYLPLQLQYPNTLHDLGPGGIDEGEGGAEELLMALDLHALPWFCGLQLIDYFTATEVWKCLIKHQTQMWLENPTNLLDWVTEFQFDTTEVFLITNHAIFAVVWWFGSSGLLRIW